MGADLELGHAVTMLDENTNGEDAPSQYISRRVRPERREEVFS